MSDFLEIKDILNEYSREVSEAVEEEIVDTSKLALREMKNQSPVKSGNYKKGWTIKKEKSFGHYEAIIHNKDAYQLTHLLEYAHMDRTGQKKILPYTHGRIGKVQEEYGIKVEHNILKKLEEL